MTKISYIEHYIINDYMLHHKHIRDACSLLMYLLFAYMPE